MGEGEEKGRGTLVAALAECAVVLSQGNDDGTPLRRLQGIAQSLVSAREDPGLRTAAFLLDAWIVDYYYNFAGDIPSTGSELVAKVREGFLAKDASTALRELSAAVQGEQMEGTMRAFVRLVSGYLDAIEEANRQV